MDRTVIIVAGGTGRRMGASVPKQFLLLDDQPVLWHTLSAFYNFDPSLNLILVLHPDWFNTWETLSASFPSNIPLTLVQGGATRAESVKNGLQETSGNIWIAVHDAVRPLIRPQLLKRLFLEAEEHGNAVPVLPVGDSVRQGNKQSSRAVNRQSLHLVQTPQVFTRTDLIKAFHYPGFETFTDEASLLEKTGTSIHLTDGDPFNIKITTPEDLTQASCLLQNIS